MPFPIDACPAEALATAPGRDILVIDDSPLIREAAKVALGTIGGWRIATAVSGEEGIERAVSEHFHAILLDVVMPGIDGIAVAERLHSIPATGSLPIVLMTADDRLEDSERFRSLTVTGVIPKPFDIYDLSRQIASLLRWPA
jgi:CheY-like chemotaxis protein